MDNVLLVTDWVLAAMSSIWAFCISNFYTAILPTLGLVGIVYKLIKKVFR